MLENAGHTGGETTVKSLRPFSPCHHKSALACQTTWADGANAMWQSMTGMEALIKMLLKCVQVRWALCFDAGNC